MRFRVVPKSSTLDDLELLYVQIFSEFCASWHKRCIDYVDIAGRS